MSRADRLVLDRSLRQGAQANEGESREHSYALLWRRAAVPALKTPEVQGATRNMQFASGIAYMYKI